MKNFLIIISAILSFLCIGNTHPVLAFPPASPPGVENCVTSKHVLIPCGGSWDDVYNGVAYHCTCNCGNNSNPYECVAVSSAGGGSSGSSGKANFGSDTTGQAFFTPNQITELQDWAKNNSQKWDAFQARALQNGYPNLDALLRAASGGMPFNDFAIREIMKYINNNDTRLVRDDSEIPNATFYKGYDKNKSPVKNAEPTPAAGKTPNPNLPVGNDTGGVYIGSGTVPQLLRTNNDMTVEERERLRLNSVVDQNRLVNMDAGIIQGVQDETSGKQEKSNALIAVLSEGLGIAVEPGKDYYAEESRKKLVAEFGISEEAGETAGSIAGILMSIYTIGKDLAKGDVVGALSEMPGGVVALLPEGLAGTGGVAVTGGAVYTYFAGKVGDRAVESTNDAASTLIGRNVDVTGGKSFSETANETIHENLGRLKAFVFEGKNLDGTY